MVNNLQSKNSMKRKVFSGLFWAYGERITAQLVSLVVTIVLARLVSPNEYGIISLVTIFITLANVFVTDGFGNALVQKKEADELDFSTVFWFNLFFSFLLLAGIWIIAKPISLFYEMDALKWVMRIMGFRIPVAAVNSIQRAYISRKMEFKKFFFSTSFGTLVSAVVGIGLAYSGFGVWALVVQYLANSTIDTVILLLTTKWHPKAKFSSERLKPLVSFGWRILSVSLMNALYTDLRNIVIGKKYSSSDLAYCNKGQQFPALIAVNINVTITNVIFPVLSKVQDDEERILKLTRKAISVGTYLMAPLLLGLFAVAGLVVNLLLTEKWLPCVPYMRIMCVVYLLQPIQTASIQAMKALGKSEIYLKLELIKKVCGLGILAGSLLLFSSIKAVIMSALIAEIFSTVLNFPANKRLISYGYKEQILDIVKSSLPGIIMCVIMCQISFFLSGIIANLIVLLVVEIVIGGMIYVLLSLLLKDETFQYLMDIVKDVFKEKVKNRQ